MQTSKDTNKNLMQEISVVKCHSNFFKYYRAYLERLLLLSYRRIKQVDNNLLDIL